MTVTAQVSVGVSDQSVGLAEKAGPDVATRAMLKREFASYLHDTVLQTLALMQYHQRTLSDVRALARIQESELRAWLAVVDTCAAQSISSALRRIVREVAQTYGLAIDVITAATCESAHAVEALLFATREALVNAAKHARSDRVDVYASATHNSVTVWIRDRGVGFDPTNVASDRWGIAQSIRSRIASAGGAAVVTSRPGEGTEIELTVPRSDAADNAGGFLVRPCA
jgi:signal transduction histidine kinase